jgi:excisionase family DNA binding protein
MEKIQFIQILPSEFKQLISESVKKQIEEFKDQLQSKKHQEFLTRAEVSKLLRVNLSTIHNWCKSGKLLPYGIGNRVYFKRDEVEGAIKRIKH